MLCFINTLFKNLTNICWCIRKILFTRHVISCRLVCYNVTLLDYAANYAFTSHHITYYLMLLYLSKTYLIFQNIPAYNCHFECAKL